MYDSYGSLSYSRNQTYQRFVFAKEKNCLGERCYKFIGVFMFQSLDNNTAILKVSDTIDLTPYTHGL